MITECGNIYLLPSLFFLVVFLDDDSDRNGCHKRGSCDFGDEPLELELCDKPSIHANERELSSHYSGYPDVIITGAV